MGKLTYSSKKVYKGCFCLVLPPLRLKRFRPLLEVSIWPSVKKYAPRNCCAHFALADGRCAPHTYKFSWNNVFLTACAAFINFLLSKIVWKDNSTFSEKKSQLFCYLHIWENALFLRTDFFILPPFSVLSWNKESKTCKEGFTLSAIVSANKKRLSWAQSERKWLLHQAATRMPSWPSRIFLI